MSPPTPLENLSGPSGTDFDLTGKHKRRVGTATVNDDVARVAVATDHPGADSTIALAVGVKVEDIGVAWRNASDLNGLFKIRRQHIGAAQPGLAVCWPRPSARSPGATFFVITEPEPTMAPAPMVTGATSASSAG